MQLPSKTPVLGRNLRSKGVMIPLLWQNGLQNRQCHTPYTFGKPSKCWLCVHDQDLAHCLVKQARDHIWSNKTLTNKYLFIIFINKYLPCVQYNFTKILWNICQIFGKFLPKIHSTTNPKVYSTNTILATLGEWPILGKTRLYSKAMQNDLKGGKEEISKHLTVSSQNDTLELRFNCIH